MAVPSVSLSFSPPVSPAILTGVARVGTAAFRLLTGSTASSVVGTGGTAVELSASSLLLSSVSLAETRLAAVQSSGSAAAGQDEVLAAAQDLTEAFNQLQTTVADVQGVFTAIAGASTFGQFSSSVNALASDFLVADEAAVEALQSIGITLQALPGGADIVAPLVIDEAVLQAAVAADQSGTQAVIAGTAQALADLASGFESDVAEATATLANVSPVATLAAGEADLGTALGVDATAATPLAALPTSALQNLPADTVLNAVTANDLDLAAAGVDEAALQTEATTTENGLAATLLATADETTAATAVLATNAANDRLTALLAINATATVVTTDTTVTPEVAGAAAPTAAEAVATAVGQPVATETTPTAIPAAGVPAVAVGLDGNAADISAAAATQALRVQLANPTRLAINNVEDPAYAALIAATHLSDFVTPEPVVDPRRLLADVPTSVSAAARAHGIAYYREVGDEESRRIRGQIDQEV
jgi:hypothetical protein